MIKLYEVVIKFGVKIGETNYRGQTRSSQNPPNTSEIKMTLRKFKEIHCIYTRTFNCVFLFF